MAIRKSSQSDSTPITIVHKLGNALEQVEERIRERAYQLFLGRKTGEGDAVADWLEAQFQLVTPVELVLKDQKKNIVVEGNLKGFKPKEIEIEVSAGQLKVFGSHTESSSAETGEATRSSSDTMHFYQVVPLTSEVDVDACRATLLKNGKLKITMPKVEG